MSMNVTPKPRTLASHRHRLAIVAGQYNSEFTDPLVEATVDQLSEVLPNARVDLIRVPGAFEIPLATKLLLANEKPSAVICLGVIFEGETAHADLIATSVTDQLMAMSLEFNTPVIHEVLLLETQEQAHARCIGGEINRGTDAANTAATMLEVVRELNVNAHRNSPRGAHRR